MREKIPDLLEQLESLVGTDDLEYEMDRLMERIEEQGAGLETVPSLLEIMERHPLDDFGVPGAMVHFMERFFHQGYEKELTASLRRRPACHTVWMLNRVINGTQDPEREEYLALLREIAGNRQWEESIRERAQDYLDYQNQR